jgi:hypothetical protein
MELLDRYLHAVRFWLPSRQQDDILAELSEDLLSQIGDEEAKLARKLNENELVEILKRRGDPMLVAGRFLPEQQLIGPPWFPVYIFVLKLVLLWVLLPLCILIASGTALLSAHDRASAILQILGGFWMGALSAFATITIVFAVLDRFHHKLYEKDWDPRKLPAVPKPRDPRKIPRAGSIAEIIWGLIFVLWWVDVLRIPAFPGNTVHVTMAPVWQQFYWPILLLSLAGMILACANLARPWWSRLRAGIRLAIDATIVVMACLLTRMNTLVDITAVNISRAELEKLRQVAEFGLPITFLIVAIIGVFGCLQGVRRMMPVKAPAHANMCGLGVSADK